MTASFSQAAAVAVAGLYLVAVAHGQAPVQERPAPADASILGQVVDASGAPVAGAVVTLSGGLAQISLTTSAARELEGGPHRVLADAEGRFVFSGLAAGSYSLTATKSGYLPGAYGRRRHGAAAQSLVLAQSERQTTVKIPIWEFVAINGMVTDEAGEPMVGIRVTAQRQTFIATRPRLSAPVATVLTDDRGIYRIDGLQPGAYVVCVSTIQISLPAALVDAYRQGASPDLQRVLSSADERVFSGGALAGRQLGDSVIVGGRMQPPAVPESGDQPAAYVTRCYPGATPADAQRLVLDSGGERHNVDIALQPVPTAAVTGTISAASGSVSNVLVRLLPAYAASLASDLGADTAQAITDANGAFLLPSVPHGDYTLKVLRAPLAPAGPILPSGVPPVSTESTGWATMPLSVGEDGVTGLNVALQTGFRLTGRLELDGTSTKPGPDLIEKFSIQLDPADGSGSRMPVALRGTIDRNGRISTNEIPPGRYVVLFLAFAPDRLAMPGWEAVGATIDGRDASHTPFELTRDVSTLVMTLSDRAPSITGLVRDAQGVPDPGAAVLMFPADRERWVDRGFSTRAMRLLRAGQDGRYRLGSVPPGDYIVAALPDEEAGDWENPEVLLAAMRVGTRVSMSTGNKSIDLVTTPLRVGGR